MESELIKMLTPVLNAMGEDGGKVLAMLQNELATQPIVDFCNAQAGWDYEKNVPIFSDWRLGQRSPLNKDATIWAMVHTNREIVVFTLMGVKMKDTGKTGFQFYREVIFNPGQCHGPIAHTALVAELERFMKEAERDEPDDDTDEIDQPSPPAPARNGAASSPTSAE